MTMMMMMTNEKKSRAAFMKHLVFFFFFIIIIVLRLFLSLLCWSINHVNHIIIINIVVVVVVMSLVAFTFFSLFLLCFILPLPRSNLFALFFSSFNEMFILSTLCVLCLCYVSFVNRCFACCRKQNDNTSSKQNMMRRRRKHEDDEEEIVIFFDEQKLFSRLIEVNIFWCFFVRWVGKNKRLVVFCIQKKRNLKFDVHLICRIWFFILKVNALDTYQIKSTTKIITYEWYCAWRKLNSSLILSNVSAIVNFSGPWGGGPCKKNNNLLLFLFS